MYYIFIIILFLKAIYNVSLALDVIHLHSVIDKISEKEALIADLSVGAKPLCDLRSLRVCIIMIRTVS